MLRAIKKPSRRRDLSLCVLSAALLILAFPRFDLSLFAWGGLIPLMFVLDGKRPAAAFGWAFLCGLLFFAGTLYWFFNLTRWFSYIAAAGVSALLCYLALYYGIWGLLYCYFSWRAKMIRLFLLPSAWVVLEWARGHLFTGFDWAGLGHSQYKNLFVIQIADITGVYGVSFLVVMVNVVFKELAGARDHQRPRGGWEQNRVVLCLAGALMLPVLVYGMFRLEEGTHGGRVPQTVSIALVQANIGQEEKWDKAAGDDIIRRHIALSEQAVIDRPRLLIWPETSHAGILWEERQQFIALQDFTRRINIPVLFGSIVKQGKDYYNAALLLSGEGAVTGMYRKIHLVPFGEFLPLRNIFPFLSGLVDIGDFTPGDQWTVFTVDQPFQDRTVTKNFSVLICFEDTVAALSRKFTREGAHLLVNMTNDAWFGDTKAPYMHLQAAVFRTVENRRSLVRAANTGISCIIDPRGKIRQCVEGPKKGGTSKTYVSGYTAGEAEFSDRITFYTKYGDIFTFLCFGCILLGIIRRRETKQGSTNILPDARGS